MIYTQLFFQLNGNILGPINENGPDNIDLNENWTL